MSDQQFQVVKRIPAAMPAASRRSVVEGIIKYHRMCATWPIFWAWSVSRWGPSSSG